MASTADSAPEPWNQETKDKFESEAEDGQQREQFNLIPIRHLLIRLRDASSMSGIRGPDR
ncbi:hypothetical protein MMYC01_204187 [Madurella mycetomatis]|uniref:Uncharacterized protein n=1 Tax=Madurella mycetomatis TaxID=100816 RepID=A0A175W6E6_9PEZI|nr:hypothetical protein MMYC01_204187 [Madurella mycetomatis]